MRVRLALTLDIDRRRYELAAPDREAALDALVETSEPRHDAPRIGFTGTIQEDA